MNTPQAYEVSCEEHKDRLRRAAEARLVRTANDQEANRQPAHGARAWIGRQLINLGEHLSQSEQLKHSRGKA